MCLDEPVGRLDARHDWHGHVHHHEVRLHARCERDARAPVGGRAHQHETRSRGHRVDDGGAGRGMVVDEQDPDHAAGLRREQQLGTMPATHY